MHIKNRQFYKDIRAIIRYYIAFKTLGDIQEVLEERNFVSIHRQYLVNLYQIKKIIKGDCNYLIMSNDESIPVARNKKKKQIE